MLAPLVLLAAATVTAQPTPSGWYPHEGGLMKYRVAIRFGEEPDTMPDGWKFGRVSSVAVNPQATEVYVFHRGKKADPLVVFDIKGKYLRSWGKGMFGNPHGLRCDREGNIWITDNGNHQVMKFDKNGKLLLTLGKKGVAGTTPDTFNRPTDIAFSPDFKYFYVSDGYGNSRVVKFTMAGKYVKDWGKKGKGPSEFNTVHSVAVDSKGTVYVSDRENNRIQIFDPEGKLLKTWNNLGATQNIFITPKDEVWVITHRNNIENLTYDTLAGRIMKIDINTGKVLGAMECPGHWLHYASNGEIYIGSLTGNVFRWYPGWLDHGLGETEGLTPANAK